MWFWCIHLTWWSLRTASIVENKNTTVGTDLLLVGVNYISCWFQGNNCTKNTRKEIFFYFTALLTTMNLRTLSVHVARVVNFPQKKKIYDSQEHYLFFHRNSRTYFFFIASWLEMRNSSDWNCSSEQQAVLRRTARFNQKGLLTLVLCQWWWMVSVLPCSINYKRLLRSY